MTKYSFTTFAVGLSILSVAIASPVPELPEPRKCLGEKKFTKTKEEEFFKPAQIMSGQICTSNKDQPCSLGRTFEHTFSIEGAVGISPGVEIKKVFDLGFSAGISWSHSDASATSVQENCPQGDPGFSCALTASAKYVRVSGTSQNFVTSLDLCQGLRVGDPIGSPAPYSFEAPKTLKGGVNSADSVEVTWGLCITPQSLNQTPQSTVPLCSVAVPGQPLLVAPDPNASNGDGSGDGNTGDSGAGNSGEGDSGDGSGDGSRNADDGSGGSSNGDGADNGGDSGDDN